MTIFNRIFGKPTQEPSALTTLDKLIETLEMLEKKEKVFLKKAAAEWKWLETLQEQRTGGEHKRCGQTENMKLIQEALSTPIGSAADFDEDELEAELEELEGAELEEQPLQSATTTHAAPVHSQPGRLPTRPAPQKHTAEEDELAALQAEMTL